MKHVIKIYPIYFDKVIKGLKKAELRNNDRDYKPRDIVVMREWCPNKQSYTGNSVTVKITCVNDVSSFTNVENQVMFSFVIIED